MAERARYLVVFHIKNASHARLAIMIPRLTHLLGKLSREPIEQAFRSATADLFGYSLLTDMNPTQLKAAIESPGGSITSDVEPILAGDDALMILELGKQFHCGVGFTRFATWMQRHQ